MDTPKEAEEKIEKQTPSEKKSLDKSLYNWKDTALSEEDLKRFCKKNDIDFQIADIQDFADENVATPKHKGVFLFTGNEKDDINKGNTKHFLYLWLNHIFDSYGSHDYGLSNDIGYFKNHPRQYQEYNSMVCGEYCLAFAKFIQDNPELKAEDGHEFAEEYGLTNNKKHNDEIIKTWYEDNK